MILNRHHEHITRDSHIVRRLARSADSLKANYGQENFTAAEQEEFCGKFKTIAKRVGFPGAIKKGE